MMGSRNRCQHRSSTHSVRVVWDAHAGVVRLDVLCPSRTTKNVHTDLMITHPRPTMEYLIARELDDLITRHLGAGFMLNADGKIVARPILKVVKS